MPPKKAPKKTKEDIEAEKRKKEDEERLARELEEKKAEEERIRKELEAKQLQEQQIAARQAELERLAVEMEEFAVEREARRSALEHEEQKEARDIAWQKYLLCDPRPDATSLLDINTFLSLSKEEKVSDLSDAFKAVTYMEGLASSLQRVIANAHANGDMDKIQTYRDLLSRLWQAGLEKIDRATAQVLQYAEELEETKGGEVTVTRRDGGFRYGLWVNREVRAKKKLVDFGGGGGEAAAAMSIDVPKQLAQVFIACRNLYLPFDREVVRGGGKEITFPINAIPLSEQGPNAVFGSFLVLGGIYMLDVLSIPPLPKKIKGWVLRAETAMASDIQRVPYPIGHADNAPLAALAAAPPIRCTFEVPGGLVLPLEPRVGWWDAANQVWSEEFITEQDFHTEKRAMRFQTLKAGIFALLQPITEDLPYDNWSLEPVYEVPSEVGEEPCPQVHFTITTPRLTVKILVKGHKCRLLEPELPELSHLLSGGGGGKEGEGWCEAGELLHALSRAGVHLMPSDDAAREPLVPKERELEGHFCREVASVAASFDFKSSWRNGPLGSARSIFHIRESSAFIGHNKEVLDYSTLLLEKDEASESAALAPGVGLLGGPACKFSVIKTLADDDESEQQSSKWCTPLDGDNGGSSQTTATHVHLLQSLKASPNLASEEALERVAATSTRFENTVVQLLTMTRVISFS